MGEKKRNAKGVRRNGEWASMPACAPGRVSEKSVVAVPKKFDEFHVAEFRELLANFGLNVGVVGMELCQ